MRRGVSALLLVLSFSLFAQAPQPDAAAVPLQIESKILGETRTALVRVPPSYARGAAAYPVIYLTDGDRQLPHIAAVADFLAREGRMPEVILVGITNTDRTRDLTPTNVVNADLGGQRFNFPTSGGADKFLQFIETEVIPKIESDYRTLPYRVFAGHSFGGLFAMHALFARPKLFNGVIAVSPTLTWDGNYVNRKAAEFVAANRELKSTVFVARTSERVGFTIRAPEGTTNFAGYRLLQAGHVKEAIDVFRANVDAHPASANVYDSLGEAYERSGDLLNARKNYERAAEIGKKLNDPNTAIFERNRDRVTKGAAAAGGDR